MICAHEMCDEFSLRLTEDIRKMYSIEMTTTAVSSRLEIFECLCFVRRVGWWLCCSKRLVSGDKSSVIFNSNRFAKAKLKFR